MAEVKRLNYFNSQFLEEKDFKDEQAYQVEMRRRHNQNLHRWGVAQGLDVTVTGTRQVTISPGMAVDNQGREIVLTEARPLTLTESTLITVAYADVKDEADRRTGGGVDNYIRITERPQVATNANPPADGSVIILARVTINGSDTGVDLSVRTRVGPALAPGAIGANELADGAVIGAKIAASAVDAGKIANGAIAEAKLTINAVSSRTLQDGAVATGKIADNSITPAKLVNNAVTTDKIADNAITAAKIQDGIVGTAELANNAVTEPKLANNAVSNRTLLSGAVDESKLVNGAVSNRTILDGAITANKIADGNVGTAELANNAVTTDKIADNQVTFPKLGKQLVWNSTTTLAANATAGFNTVSFPISQPRGATVLVHAYTTTSGGRFEWRQESLTGGPADNLVVNQTVFFHNLTGISIELKFRIYVIFDIFS